MKLAIVGVLLIVLAGCDSSPPVPTLMLGEYTACAYEENGTKVVKVVSGQYPILDIPIPEELEPCYIPSSDPLIFDERKPNGTIARIQNFDGESCSAIVNGRRFTSQKVNGTCDEIRIQIISVAKDAIVTTAP